MALKVIEKFDVCSLQVLDERGVMDSSIPDVFTDELIKVFFESIIRARAFNTRAVSLQREGRIGTYASFYGQEASQVGSAYAFEKGDWVLPTFRESGVLIALGYPMALLLRYWAGDERGMRCPAGQNIMPISIPVGTHIPHVTGVALGMKLKGKKNAAIGYFGEGGSSRGDFHEGLNLAGTMGVPAVFICQNNQWAISLPRSKQTAAHTIAQRAASYGMFGIQVDGNDVLAVYKATKEALQRARDGHVPTLIECLTYRLDDHTTADDAGKYRLRDEVEEWRRKEPLIRLRIYMDGKGLWTDEYEKDVTASSLEEVDEAIVDAEKMEKPSPLEIYEYTNEILSGRQIREIKEFGWRR